MSATHYDPVFQAAVDESVDAIGAVIAARLSDPMGLLATYEALVGLTVLTRFGIEQLEAEEWEIAAAKVAANAEIERHVNRAEGRRN